MQWRILGQIFWMIQSNFDRRVLDNPTDQSRCFSPVHCSVINELGLGRDWTVDNNNDNLVLSNYLPDNRAMWKMLAGCVFYSLYIFLRHIYVDFVCIYYCRPGPGPPIPYLCSFLVNNLIPGPGSEHNKQLSQDPTQHTFGCITNYLPDTRARTTPINCILATIYVSACENNSGDTASVRKLQRQGES